ncbi:MFS transporter [Paenibacillus sp. FSL A5-0031]|uniref:MFS transporter n=1 Tax=Paenibacillus sp. FSL A5-0031 TaxID=1920420 RepID=UPI00096D9B19|nr:MFS transporter [Paenibacillus sp. FSL A5-0031]OME80223.1 MFS transporter [Paenibacillus sp. FSL A5-0031]
MQSQESSSRLWTKPFLILTLSTLLLFLNLQMLLAAFPAYVKSAFQADDLTVSLIISVFAGSTIITRLLTAQLMRIVRRNVILYAGLAAACLFTVMSVAAGSVGMLLVMRVGFGIGFGMASTIIPTLVSQIIPGKRMGEGIGYFGLSTSLAMSVGPIIGLSVMKHAGFTILAMLGTATILLIFPILLLSRAIPPDTSKKTAPAAGSASKQLFHAKLLIPGLLNVILAVTYGGLLSFIALFGESVHLEQVGLFFLFNAIAVIIIRPVSGKLFDRFGHAAVLIPAAISVVSALMVLSYTTTMPMLILSALLYGLGFGSIQPTLQAWMLRSGTPQHYGMANSMFYNTTDLGIAVGALILGAVSSMSDYAFMYRISAGFMVLFLILYIVVRLLSAVRYKFKQSAGQTT